MRTTLLFVIVLCFGSLFAQRTKSNTARINFTHYPTVPIEGVKEIGIQVYTANLSFNRDTLRLYLDNIDIMKSDFEQLSKVDFKALNQVSIVGGEGDITVDMALGQPVVLSKELKTASCMIAKDGCVQYYYKVKYNLPAVVQARNLEGILNTWTLDSEMEFQFGNEQIEKHTSTVEASITSVQVINYTSEMDLALAFNEVGESALTRKAIIKQLGRMAESIYDNLFFNETRLKLDIAYGAGSATDYAETEKASENAIAALERLDYASLKGPIKIWESWLERYSPEDKKAAVNNKVAQGFHENLSIAFTFTNEFDKARKHLDSAIELAQIGIVNRNEVDRLKEFHEFIDKQEKVKKYNSSLKPISFVNAPDIKNLLGRRKYNNTIDFLIAEDKYAEIIKNHSKNSPKKDISEMTIDEFMNQPTPDVDSDKASDDKEVSIEGRVSNNQLIFSGIVDYNMRGKALPVSVCEYLDLKVIRARNIGFTSLPDCMEVLSKLEKLYINSNLFEELPDVFGSMKSLEVLDISNNNLKSLPPSIYTLTNLKKIFISGNKLSDSDIQKLKASLPTTTFK